VESDIVVGFLRGEVGLSQNPRLGGVRFEIIENLLKLLDLGMTPVIPLRGSISASGDLMPFPMHFDIGIAFEDTSNVGQRHQVSGGRNRSS
jgi:hypothetical protein